MPDRPHTRKRSRPQRISQDRARLIDYEVVFRCGSGATLVLDADGRILSASQAVEHILGYTPKELAGRPLADCLEKDDSIPDPAAGLLQHTSGRSRPETVACLCRRKDGSAQPVRITFCPLPDNPAHSAAACATLCATTDQQQPRSQAACALQASEIRFRAIAESTPDAVIIFNDRGMIVFWNKGARRLFGYEPDEILGRPPWVLWPQTNRGEKAALLMESFDTRTSSFDGRISEDTAMRRDGSEFPVEVSLSIWEEGPDTFFGAIIRDVTERKHAEANMTRMMSAIDQASETVMLMDADGTILSINPAITRMLGHEPHEVIGKNPFLVERPTSASSLCGDIWDSIRSGSVWSGQMENMRKDGSVFTLETTISPVRDPSGRIISYVSIGRDITAELQLEERMRQAQKMEAVGTLAGGIAHDFNNILAAIMGYTELTLAKLDDGASIEKNLSRVLSATTRAKDLVNQILTFSRQAELEKHPVHVAAVLRDTRKMLRAIIPATIDITTRETSGTMVMADTIQIQQIFLNLASNAAHAMRDSGGTLDISLRDVTLDAEQAALYQRLSPGHFLELSVQDTGSGIDPLVIDRIFDPFFTTKKIGEGTGMGLPMVHGIVESFGGAIAVQSAPGAGTTITILLPAITDVQPSRETTTASAPPRGTGAILLVDDEEAILDTGKQMLESLGYRVTARQSSVEALEAFRTDPGRFDLVLTDHTMPGMTGYDLAKCMLAIRRDIPIVLCTGYSENISVETARAAGIQEFLMKPVSLRQVAETVHCLLNTSRPHART